MAISRTKVTSTLEDALMDVAELMGEAATLQERAYDLRRRISELWPVLELGDAPEFETKVKVLRERVS